MLKCRYISIEIRDRPIIHTDLRADPPGVSKLDLAVAQATVAVAPCVAQRAPPFITKNEK